MLRELRPVAPGNAPDHSLVFAIAGFECG